MIYVIVVLGVVLLAVLVLVWLRKLQFDAVHRNFLDLVDNYGGKVLRAGFAVRPRFSGAFRDFPLSVSISAENKTANTPRQFYISVYLQAPAESNFTVLSSDWLNWKDDSDKKNRYTRQIADKRYVVEVTNQGLLQKLNFQRIEEVVKRMDPFAYVLASGKGLILERLSADLIKDTEFERLSILIESMYELSIIPVKGDVEA